MPGVKVDILGVVRSRKAAEIVNEALRAISPDMRDYNTDGKRTWQFQLSQEKCQSLSKEMLAQYRGIIAGIDFAIESLRKSLS